MKKKDFYFKEYKPFVKRLNLTDIKKMDEAFFAFGQFLNIKKQRQIIKDIL